MQRAGPLAPLLMALLAKGPRNRASGPELRAEVAHLVATRPPSPSEVLPSKGTSRTVPFRGTPQPSAPEPAETPAPPQPSTASASVSQRPQGAPAFEPTFSPPWELPPEQAPVQRPSRPVLPPAPPVPRRDRRQLAGILALLLTALLVAWLADNIDADPGERRVASATAGGSAGVDLDPPRRSRDRANRIRVKTRRIHEPAAVLSQQPRQRPCSCGFGLATSRTVCSPRSYLAVAGRVSDRGRAPLIAADRSAEPAAGEDAVGLTSAPEPVGAPRSRPR